MKKKKLAAAFLILLLAAGCGNADDAAPQGNAETETKEDVQTYASDGKAEEETKTEEGTQTDAAQTDGTEQIKEVLDSVFAAVPGTAGGALKSVTAACRLLDWSEDYAKTAEPAALQEAAGQWRQGMQEAEDSVYTDDDMLQALAAVQADAQMILTDREAMADRLEEAGCVPGHDTYTEENLQTVCDILQIVFTQGS